MIHTIAEIEVGDRVATVYHPQIPFKVIRVDDQKDEFTAECPKGVIWHRLSSDEVSKVIKKRASWL